MPSEEPDPDNPKDAKGRSAAQKKKFAQDFAEKWSRTTSEDGDAVRQALHRQEQILERDPDNVRVWYARGLLLSDIGRHSEALLCFDRVASQEPTFRGVWAARAYLLRRLGREADASESLRKALLVVAQNVSPEQHEALTGTEAMLGEMEKWSKEGLDVRPLERILEKDPPKALRVFLSFNQSVERIREVRPKIEALRDRGKDVTWALDALKKPFDFPVYETEIRQLVLPVRTREPPRPAPSPVVPPQPTPLSPEPEVHLEVPATPAPRPRDGAVSRLPKPKVLAPPVTGIPDPSRTSRPEMTARHVESAGVGKTNGLTNGRRGQTNGLGKTNGLTNGRRGQTNGLGKTNGLTNGSQRTAGVTNGLVNGLQSARTGMTNGITNGLGMTNGLGALRHAEESRAAKWKVYLVPLFSLALLLAPLLSGGESVTVRHVITVDGSLAEWSALSATRATLPPSTAVSPNVDVTEAGFVMGTELLGGFLRVRGTALAGDGLSTLDALRVFMDTDLDSSTGYAVGGLGADHMVEIRGINGTVDAATLLAYLPSGDGVDWNDWRIRGDIDVSLAGGVIEFEVPRAWLESDLMPRMTIRTQGWDRRVDDSPNLAIGPRITATQTGIAPVAGTPGAREDYLRITLEAFDQPVRVDRLTLTPTGTINPAELTLPPQIGGVPGILTAGRYLFDIAATITPDVPVTFTVSAGADSVSSGQTVGFGLAVATDIVANGAAVTLSSVSGRAVAPITGVLSGPRLDGAFGDWVPENATRADASTRGNPGIDLVASAFQAQGTEVFAYAEVAGALFSGLTVPVLPYQRITSGNFPDADRDRVPDDVDLYPRDFNNDGANDASSPADVDGDGSVDYPAGPDLFLDTTIPLSFPLPYAGMPVRVFIGLVTPPPRTGEDTLRVYVDVDAVLAQGYSRAGLYADYMLQLTGKNGHVRDAGLYRFPQGASPGDGDAWERIGTVRHMEDLSRIELSTDLGVAVNKTLASAHIDIEDVQGGQDAVAVLWPPGSPSYVIRSSPGTLGTRGAVGPTTRGSTLIDPVSDGYTTRYNHQRKAVRAGDVSGDGACDASNSDGCWYDVFSDPLKEPIHSSNYPVTETITTGCKLGVGYPKSDVDTGTWTPTPIWSRLDDGDTSDYVSATATGSDEVALTNMCDPYASTGHNIVFDARATGGGGTEKIKVDLVQGTTVIATSGALAITRGSFNVYSYALSAAEANSITDYSNLRYRLIVDTILAGGTETLDIAWTYFETSSAGSFPAHISTEEGTYITYRESRENPEAFAAYRSDAASANSIKTRTWDGMGWSAETVEADAGSSSRGTRVAVSPTAAHTYLVAQQASDGKIDVYTCTPTCSLPAGSQDLGVVWGGSTPTEPGLRLDIAYEQSSGDALLVYGVLDSDTTHDLAYKIYSGSSWGSEQYIDDTGHSGVDLQYGFVKLAAKSGSDEIALIAGDNNNDDVNAWIWDGSAWGNYIEVEGSAPDPGYGPAAVAWETSSGDLVAVTQTNNSANVAAKQFTGGSWASVTAVACLDTSTSARHIDLYPNPVSSANDMIVGIEDTSSHLNTCYWDGSGWSNRNTHITNTCSGLESCFDFAWESSGSKGLLVYGKDATASLTYRTFTAPNTFGTATDVAFSGVELFWLDMKTVKRPRTGENLITGIFGNDQSSGYCTGHFTWDGTTFTIPSSCSFTSNVGTGSRKVMAHAQATVPEDTLLVQYDWASVPEGVSYDLIVKGYREDENINVQVYDGSTWNPRITISATTNTVHTYTLTESEYQSGAPKVRFVDASGAVGYASDLYLDWVLIEATSTITVVGSRTVTTGTESGSWPTNIQTKNAAYMQYTETSDALSVQYDWTGLTSAASNSVYVKGYRTDEDINVQVYDGSVWNTRFTITATTNTLYSYVLTSAEFDSTSAGTPNIRFVDAGGASGNSVLYLDFAVVSRNYNWDRVTLMRSTSIDGTTWGSQVVLASGRAGHNPLVLRRDSAEPSIAIDSGGTLHVTFVSAVTTGDQTTINAPIYSKSLVTYPTQAELATPANWEAFTLVDVNTGYMPTVSTDTGNNPHIAWSASKSSGTVYYKNKYGGSWRTTVSWAGTYTGLSVDLSPQNNYVSLTRFYDTATDEVHYTACKNIASSNCDAAAEFTKWDGTAGYDVVATAVEAGGYPSLATTYESNGDLWVAYADNGATTRTLYARKLDYPSSGWQTAETIDTETNLIFTTPSIGIDKDGDVHALYFEYNNAFLYYKERTSSWGSRTDVALDGEMPSLAVRLPNDATYGTNMGGVYFLGTTANKWETYHYYQSVPELQDIVLPAVALLGIAFGLRRWRASRRKSEGARAQSTVT